MKIAVQLNAVVSEDMHIHYPDIYVYQPKRYDASNHSNWLTDRHTRTMEVQVVRFQVEVLRTIRFG